MTQQSRTVPLAFWAIVALMLASLVWTALRDLANV